MHICRSIRGGHSEQGFTLLELTIVMVVATIAATMAILSITNTIRGIRLDQSATAYANFLQQVRIRAVQDDKYYGVTLCPLAGTTACTSPSIDRSAFAYVDVAGTGAYAAGDPLVLLDQGVAPELVSAGPGLTALKAQFLPSGSAGQNSLNTTALGPIFGPRGLPCTPTTVGGSYTTCPFLTPTSYITFLENTESVNWQAVTVTPAGRVQVWQYDETSGWSPRS